MKILLTGGSTGGSVSPLLALASGIRQRYPTATLLFIGTSTGPERELVPTAGIAFRTVAAGKFRRYWDMRNLLDGARVIIGFIEALSLCIRFRPDIALGAGGFVQVPVLWAAKCVGASVGIHQMDVRAGLANRLIAPIARRITAAYLYPALPFPHQKVTVTGNPVRSVIVHGSRSRGQARFFVHGQTPVVLVMGGGTGARWLNNRVRDTASELLRFCQIIHVQGKGREVTGVANPDYHSYAFLGDELADAYAVADLVVARAGMGTIAECIALGKPAILIPIPASHQEANAAYFASRGAFVELAQEAPSSAFISTIRSVLLSEEQRRRLREECHKLLSPDAVEKVLDAHCEGLLKGRAT